MTESFTRAFSCGRPLVATVLQPCCHPAVNPPIRQVVSRRSRGDGYCPLSGDSRDEPLAGPP